MRLGGGWPGGPGEPVREAGFADEGVVAGDEGPLIRDVQAVIGRAGIGYDVPRIFAGAQVAPDELVQLEPFGPGQLDGAVDRCALGDIGQGSGDVIGRFGLEEDGRQRNRPVVGAGIGDAAGEFEELRRAQDRARDGSGLDCLLLGELGAEVTAALQPVGADDRQRHMMADPCGGFRGQKVAA